MGPYHTWTRNSLNASQWACATTKPGSGWWLATCSSPVITPRCRNKCIAIAICVMRYYDLLCVSHRVVIGIFGIPWLFHVVSDVSWLLFNALHRWCVASQELCKSNSQPGVWPTDGPVKSLLEFMEKTFGKVKQCSKAPSGTRYKYRTLDTNSLSLSLSFSLMSTHTHYIYIYIY